MQCVYNIHVCDGYKNCVKGEDESPPVCDMDVCHQKGRFYCNASMKCIMNFRVCDGNNDCVNGEDESLPACALIRWCVSKMSSGEGCLGECKPGYFGKYCEKTCSKECFNGSCNSSSGICTYCSPGYFGKYCQPCSEKCVDRLCNSATGICKECTSGYFGKNCEKTCSKECTNEICNRSNGVCLYGCENGYWDKKCNSKCSTNCEGDAYGNRCNSSTGECTNGCTRGWSGIFCEELTDNSIKTTLIVIAAMFTVVVGIFCYVWARKRFIRQQNERIEPGQVFPVDLKPRQQPSGSRRRQSSSVYADINEDTMEEYHYICEQNTPDHYDEINVTIFDRDIRVVPSKGFTDDSNSVQSVTESKDELGTSDESISRRSVTHPYSDLDHACNTDNLNGVSVVEFYSSIELPAASDSEKGEEIFEDSMLSGSSALFQLIDATINSIVHAFLLPWIDSDSGSTAYLANGQVYCNTSLKCIPVRELCDGIDNCHDGEDEHTFTC
ncbi:SREC2-like protein, partial [Mya arenaria]